jgi:TonB-dependent receptor
MMINKVIKIVSLVILVFAGNLSGQGTLKGVISDSLSEKSLSGANVFIIGTSLGSAANIEGEYNIYPVPAGIHTVKISYIGYKSKEIEVVIQNGKTTELNVFLSMDAVLGEEVIVTGQMMGQISAINQQRTSNTIINVVSEEKIQELPDVNAAEVMGRLPGVSILRSGGEANKIILRGLSDRYTHVTIDGIKIPPTDASGRGLDLSTISQSSLAGIELYKALTPDKDADGIAGSVNLVTKKAPAERLLKADMKGGYNNIMESFRQYDFVLRYGERFFDNVLGVQLTGNIENRLRSNERINLDYDQSLLNQTDYKIDDFLLEFTNETRKRNGATLLLDINTPDDGSIKFSNVFSSTSRNYLLSTRDYPSGGSTSSVIYNFRDREQEIGTYNSSLTGMNNLFNLRFNWGLSFAQSSSDFPYDYYLEFLEPSISGSAGMRNTPTIKENPEQLIPFAYNNFNAATLYESYYYSQKNYDKERSAFLNISGDYALGKTISGELKFGGKYKIKDRSNINGSLYAPYYLGVWRPYERMPDGTIREKQFAGTHFEDFYRRYLASPTNTSLAFSEFLGQNPESWNIFDIYLLNPLINKDRFRQWHDININGVDQNGSRAEYSNDPSVKSGNYDITERVRAGYLMNTLNIGRYITFIAGLRVEDEANDYNSRYSPVQTGGFPIPPDMTRDTSASYSETILLPNFHVNIKPTEFLNVRLAAYKALARPDFNYRLNTYFAWRGANVSSNKELLVGNPLLKTAKAWNFEINTSLFGNEIGLVSLSAYYKIIDDQYHYLSQINTQGDTLLAHFGLNWRSLHSGSYQLSVPYNSPRATKVWGFEFEHQINFTFLPGLLKNIVLSYNASLVKSETYLIGSKTDTVIYYLPQFPGIPFYSYVDRPIEVKQQLEEQPEFYGNISLGYDIGGFSGRISLFHQSEYNLSFTPSGRNDQIVNSFTRVDLALKQRLTRMISVLVNISNLTNIKEGNSIYNRVNNYKILNINEQYGITADFGIIFQL